MFFRRLVFCSLFVGFCAGFFSGAIQHFIVTPIITSAEGFESMLSSQSEALAHQSDNAHSDNAHSHGDAAWSPRDGLERIFWTMLSNVLSSFGFALLLISIIISWVLMRKGNVPTVGSGLVWGAVGWFCLFAWPALGLPPELPGEAAATLFQRQTWWLLTVVCSAAGLMLIVGIKQRWLGLFLLAMPFLVGAPHIDGPPFAHHAAEIAAQLAALKSQFIIATAITNAAQWLVLGMVSAMVIQRWLAPLLDSLGNEGSVSRIKQ